MKLLVATRSPGKQREVRRLLAGSEIDVVFPDEAGAHRSQAEDRLELGDSFAANARAKAEYFSKQTGLPTVADDSGLEVFALGGEPGVRSRRWAGAEGTEKEVDAANNALLLSRLSGAPENKRRARYRCVLVLYRKPNGFPETFEGACTGRVLASPAGTSGFGYDPLFWSDDLQKSFGEATDEEKDAVSHRARAFRALRAAIGGSLTANG
ncbi:MAG TPA: non-canonical purine NTP pyrophosphatase [Gemmatimonadales bacterium]|nr:non-canonical purine NTP pyrophosphatase [Gemmatimonadales bacterium]